MAVFSLLIEIKSLFKSTFGFNLFCFVIVNSYCWHQSPSLPLEPPRHLKTCWSSSRPFSQCNSHSVHYWTRTAFQLLKGQGKYRNCLQGPIPQSLYWQTELALQGQIFECSAHNWNIFRNGAVAPIVTRFDFQKSSTPNILNCFENLAIYFRA